jgi:RNA polymerase sigma-70 factor (ECF subfamily)
MANIGVLSATTIPTPAVRTPDSDRVALFESMALPHLHGALRLATRLVGGGEAGDELVRQAMVRAFMQPHWPSAPLEFRRWLFRLLVETRRAQAPRDFDLPGGEPAIDYDETTVLEELWDLGLDPAHTLAWMAERLGEDALEAALDRLPVPIRLVVALADVEGHRYHEIAHTLSITDDVLVARLHHGRRAVQQSLWRACGEAPRGQS